jgi:predicted small lipoprotein YifL
MAASLIDSVPFAEKSMLARRLPRPSLLVAAATLATACGARGPLYVTPRADAGGGGTQNQGSGSGSDNSGDAAGGLTSVDASALVGCSACLAQRCGTELLACVLAPACGMTFQCAARMCFSGPAPDAQCVVACANGDPQSLKLLTSAFGCVAGTCPECIGLLGSFAPAGGN